MNTNHEADKKRIEAARKVLAQCAILSQSNPYVILAQQGAMRVLKELT
jgi:hypothetical protein